MHKNLINSLFLDQLSQINTAKFSLEDKIKYTRLCTCFVLSSICKKELIGNFRMVYKLYDELRKLPISDKEKENSEFLKTNKEISKILENFRLKSKGDLVDSELPHLAFFGFNSKQKHDICHIYTTDKKEDIKERLGKILCFCKLYYLSDIGS